MVVIFQPDTKHLEIAFHPRNSLFSAEPVFTQVSLQF
jgi:hypothetical protein